MCPNRSSSEAGEPSGAVTMVARRSRITHSHDATSFGAARSIQARSRVNRQCSAMSHITQPWLLL